MSNLLVSTAIRSLFALRSREHVARRCQQLSEEYQDVATGVSDEVGKTSVLVPPLTGVDEDMRNWSFFEVLEHNLIVNRCITATVCQLAHGEPLSGAARLDPKKDVMPSGSVDGAIIGAFVESIASHIAEVGKLGPLRGTNKSNHPVFGPFDAHRWNCMFAFHLGLHLPQVKLILSKAKSDAGDGAGS